MPHDRPGLEGLLNDPAVSYPLKVVLLAWWNRDPLDAANDAAALAGVMADRATFVLDTVTAHGAGRDRFLDWAQVGRLTNLCRTTAWRMRRAGDFPQPASISPGRVAWRERDIAAWIESRATPASPFAAGGPSEHQPDREKGHGLPSSPRVGPGRADGEDLRQ